MTGKWLAQVIVISICVSLFLPTTAVNGLRTESVIFINSLQNWVLNLENASLAFPRDFRLMPKCVNSQATNRLLVYYLLF